MTTRKYNVLFLCTGNSARSIIAEALLQRRGAGKFNAYSAGSNPKGRVHPLALKILTMNDFNTTHFHSKSWEEFSGPDAPTMNFVFTVCGRAAGEECPLWMGSPTTSHWGVEDPDRVDLTDDEQWQLFENTYAALDQKIRLFTKLPIKKLSSQSLQQQLDMIGRESIN